MTKLLEKAFKEAENLPEDEQDVFAAFILSEITSEHQWKEQFEDSKEELKSLAEEALDEHQRGETEGLDPNSL